MYVCSSDMVHAEYFTHTQDNNICYHVFCDPQLVFSTRSYSSTDIAEALNGHCYNVATSWSSAGV